VQAVSTGTLDATSSGGSVGVIGASSFNSSTSVGRSLITLANHGYATGDKVRYSVVSGSPIGGLTNNTDPPGVRR
jgi:hypothetical protein